MKKQFISLMMVLAMVILAGTSAMAQTGDPDDPFYHINNSQHTFTITDNGNTMGWQVFIDDGITEGAEVTTNTAHVASISGEATGQMTMTWAETAAGTYSIRATETTSASCVTIRKVFVYLIDFDVHVYVSDVNGGNLESGVDYADCGVGTVANYGDLPGSDGGAFSQSIDIDGTGSTGDLSVEVGTSPRTSRYISLAITWNTPASGAYNTDFTAPDIASVTFDATVTTDAGTDFISIGNFTGTAAGDLVTENTEPSENVFTTEMILNARWGVDQNIQVLAQNVTLYSAADAGGTQLGTELDGNEASNVQGVDATAEYQNTTDNQVILGAPATSTITVN